MPSLPLELYTPILDGVDRADLFRLSLVSRTFQTEAEQRIHRSIYFHSWRHILASLKRLLSVPRIFSFIKELSITDDNNRPYEEGPHSYIFLSAVFRTLGSALARMTELVFLSVSAYAAGESRYWVTCRGLFERSAFQVHALRCPFAMDISLISFLAKQPHIHEFFWYPISSANHKLCPPTLLPMLSTVHFKHTEMDQILPLVTSRPLTHCWWMYEASTFEFLRLSSVLIRAIRYQPFQSDELSILAQRCPDLEHLEFIEFGEVREEFFIDQILPCFRRLVSLMVQPNMEIVVDYGDEESVDRQDSALQSLTTKFHIACPSLRRLMLYVGYKCKLYEWDETGQDVNAIWLLTAPDLWYGSVPCPHGTGF